MFLEELLLKFCLCDYWKKLLVIKSFSTALFEFLLFEIKLSFKILNILLIFITYGSLYGIWIIHLLTFLLLVFGIKTLFICFIVMEHDLSIF